MLITVIVCTYRRAAETLRLLHCLELQSYGDVEVLVVDGSGDDDAVRETLLGRAPRNIRMRLIDSAKGLTRQRNVGLKNASGEIIAFFDDDVTMEPDFLARVAAIFAGPGALDIGGLTAYDVVNYPALPNLRWRLRRILRVVSTLEPGFADRLGCNVPISFTRPFTGLRKVSWLPGFCMIYRRAAVEGLAFDEQLPTYGGEDRDFSMRVGDGWRLVLAGDLPIRHLCSTVNRVSGNNQIFQTAFGIGRGFRKRCRSWSDIAVVITYAMREFLVESLAGFKHPSIDSFSAPFARLRGLIAGWGSLSAFPATEAMELKSLSHDSNSSRGSQAPV